jgi:hypothetical protein
MIRKHITLWRVALLFAVSSVVAESTLTKWGQYGLLSVVL